MVGITRLAQPDDLNAPLMPRFAQQLSLVNCFHLPYRVADRQILRLCEAIGEHPNWLMVLREIEGIAPTSFRSNQLAIG